MALTQSRFLIQYLEKHPGAKKELRQALHLTPKQFARFLAGEEPSKFRASKTKPSASGKTGLEQVLDGDDKAKKEYCATLLSCGLPTSCVERLLSLEGIERLKEAKSKGINPEAVLILCRDSIAMSWTQDPLLKMKEARDGAKELRKAARILRRWLPCATFTMPQPPLREHLYQLTGSDPAVKCGTLLTGEKMTTLQNVAGKEGSSGLLMELAEAFGGVAPILGGMKRKRQPIAVHEQYFLTGWDQLARRSTGGPCDKLGTEFFNMTLGMTIRSEETFRKMRKRAVLMLEEQVKQRECSRIASLPTGDLETPPPDDLDIKTWTHEEAKRQEAKHLKNKSLEKKRIYGKRFYKDA